MDETNDHKTNDSKTSDKTSDDTTTLISLVCFVVLSILYNVMSSFCLCLLSQKRQSSFSSTAVPTSVTASPPAQLSSNAPSAERCLISPAEIFSESSYLPASSTSRSHPTSSNLFSSSSSSVPSVLNALYLADLSDPVQYYSDLSSSSQQNTLV